MDECRIRGRGAVAESRRDAGGCLRKCARLSSQPDGAAVSRLRRPLGSRARARTDG